jgi:Sensors of blue-light using FAD
MLGTMDASGTLIHCIYASSGAREFREHDIPALLETTRENNARLAVTGMLLYVEGSFFQVLEGPADKVDPLYEKIRADRRHMRVTQIIREPLMQRRFPDWSMGFSSVALSELGALTGENDFFKDATCLAQVGGGRAKKLLNTFRDGRWRAEHTGTFRVTTPST